MAKYNTYTLPLVTVVLWIFCLPTYAGHPSMNGMPEEMSHPSQAVPSEVLIPSIIANINPDPMDGFNLILALRNFNVTAPPRNVPADNSSDVSNNKKITLPGHMHLYINGEKRSRIYGEFFHLPASWLKMGINSITVSLNNHNHGTFTFEDKEIQSTIIIDTREVSDQKLVKSQYSWPGTTGIKN